MRQSFYTINEALLTGAVAVQVSVGARAERIADSPRLNRRTAALSSAAALGTLVGTRSYAASVSSCTGSAATNLINLIKSAAGFMIALGAAGALLMLAVGAALIIFGGTPDRVSKGMKMIKNVVIGLAILGTGAFLRYVVVDFISGATGGNSNNSSSCLSTDRASNGLASAAN